MKYKLLALDIDGTLVDKNVKVHQSTIDLLNKVIDKGIIVILATGRMYPSALAIAKKFDISTPLIVYNGAQIRDVKDDGYIFSKPIPLEVGKKIINFCKVNNLYLQLYENDSILVEKIVEETRIDPDLAFSPCKEVGNFLDYDLLPSPKKMIITDPDNAENVINRLKSLLMDNIHIARSKPYLIELIHPQVSKAKALKLLASKYNIKQEEVIAIGDNDNDLEMISWAGLGAAVGNGSENLKDRAQYIGKATYNLGVEEIIHKFLIWIYS